MVVTEAEKTHVAFLPSPGMGHIVPLFELAKRLVIHHDFRVSFLVFTTEASGAQNQLLHSPTLPPDLQVVDIPPADLSSVDTSDMPVLTHLCTIVHESLLRSLRSILIELNRPNALIIDIFCTEAFEICEELSIPTYSFFTASSWLLAFSLYLPTLDLEVHGEFVHLLEPVQVPGSKPIRTEDLLDQVRNRKIEEYQWYLYHTSRLPLAAGILTNTWDDLEPGTLRALKENPFFKNIRTPPVHAIGPLIKEREGKDEILSWLDCQPNDSVIFICFGSGGTLSSKQLIELAWGLELSEQRFILVARKPSDTTASEAYFSVGRDENDPVSYLPDGFLQRMEGVGLVVRSWAPQLEVLRHPSTGAFLTHCGWNSSLEGVVHGLPMIAWPLFADQRMNATILSEEIGVAIKPVATEKAGEKVIVGRKEIERVARLVIEGEEGKIIKSKARALKKSARRALDTGGSSSVAICHLAKIWKSDVSFTHS